MKAPSPPILPEPFWIGLAGPKGAPSRVTEVGSYEALALR